MYAPTQLTKGKIPASTYALAYEADVTVGYIKPALHILNKAVTDIKIRIAITNGKQYQTTPDASLVAAGSIVINPAPNVYVILNEEDFIEYDFTITASNVYDLSSILVLPGERMYIKADVVGGVFRIAGVQNSITG